MHSWLRLVYRVRSACRAVRRYSSETNYLIMHVAVSPVTNTIGTRGDHENSTVSPKLKAPIVQGSIEQEQAEFASSVYVVFKG